MNLPSMAANVVCGRCGAVLATPTQTCPRCGAQAAPNFANPFARPFVGAPPTSRKSPALAAALSVIPGLGHIYLGLPTKGLVYMLGAGGLEFLGFDFDLTAIGALVGIPMGLSGFALWAHGIFDAYREAKRLNAQAGF
jgi:TM2 domain-containing membrane protein YozV